MATVVLTSPEDTLISGAIHTINSSGGTRSPVVSAYQVVRRGHCASQWPEPVVERSRTPLDDVQYLDVAIHTASGTFTTSVSSSDEDLVDVAIDALRTLMRPQVRAVFIAQDWHGDHAMPTGQRTIFNCLDAFTGMSLDEARRHMVPGILRDTLAQGLPERQTHDGPFEVIVNEADLVRVVHLFCDRHDQPVASDATLESVTKPMWMKFRRRVRQVLDMAASGGGASGVAALTPQLPLDVAGTPASAELQVTPAASDPAPSNVDSDDEAEDGSPWEAVRLAQEDMSPEAARRDHALPQDPGEAFAAGWNARSKVDGALDRLIQAFGQGYPNSLREDMRVVVAEMAKLRNKPQLAPRQVKKPPKKSGRIAATGPGTAISNKPRR